MADGPDDPKQKADKAWRWCERQWDRAPSPSQMVEAAVTASIEAALEKSDCDMIDYVAASIDAHAADTRPMAKALVEALAPVLERVARLEELAQFPKLLAENDALLQKMAAAGPEGEAACTRHGQYRCPACAAGMVEEAQPPSPAESKGSGQWRAGRSIGRTLYIGDKCIGMVDTPELAAAIVEAMNAPSRSASDPASPDCGNPRRCEHAKAEHAIGHGCTARLPDGSECECGWYPPAPAATQDIPQSVPQAPERCAGCGMYPDEIDPKKECEAGGTLGHHMIAVDELGRALPSVAAQAPERIEIFMSQSLGWQISRVGGGIAYVRADVHAKACIDSRRLGEEHVRLLDERGDFTEGSRPWRCEKELEKARTALASAERRIAELEGTNAAIQVDLADFTNAAFANGRAEGREAGIREAAEVARAMRDADTGPSEYAQGARQGLQLAGRRILALLAKKPEVGT